VRGHFTVAFLLLSWHYNGPCVTCLVKARFYSLSLNFALFSCLLWNLSCHKSSATLKSSIEMSDLTASSQLISGFYELSENRWRWTAPTFTVALAPPLVAGQQATRPATLHVQLYFPPAQIDQLGPVTVEAESPGYEYGHVTYKEGGPHEFVVTIPQDALCTNLLPVTFSLDKYRPGSKNDARDLGVVVSSIRLQSE
jgi:hypothetical protein